MTYNNCPGYISVGGIVGIVIACLAIVGGIIACVICCNRRGQLTMAQPAQGPVIVAMSPQQLQQGVAFYAPQQQQQVGQQWQQPQQGGQQWQPQQQHFQQKY